VLFGVSRLVLQVVSAWCVGSINSRVGAKVTNIVRSYVLVAYYGYVVVQGRSCHFSQNDRVSEVKCASSLNRSSRRSADGYVWGYTMLYTQCCIQDNGCVRIMQKRLVAHEVPQPVVAGGGGRAACVFGLV
jgi:hypothetical protein